MIYNTVMAHTNASLQAFNNPIHFSLNFFPVFDFSIGISNFLTKFISYVILSFYDLKLVKKMEFF